MAIEHAHFGSTGHHSSRVFFGAVALAGATPAESEATLALVLEHGINHIDTASSYGDSEDQLRPWLAECRDRFFLATKTGERTATGGRESIHRSLERMGVAGVEYAGGGVTRNGDSTVAIRIHVSGACFDAISHGDRWPNPSARCAQAS